MVVLVDHVVLCVTEPDFWGNYLLWAKMTKKAQKCPKGFLTFLSCVIRFWLKLVYN